MHTKFPDPGKTPDYDGTMWNILRILGLGGNGNINGIHRLQII